MDKKKQKFDNTEIEVHEFNQHKSPISINDIVIIKIVSNMLAFSIQNFKHFIGYKGNK